MKKILTLLLICTSLVCKSQIHKSPDKWVQFNNVTIDSIFFFGVRDTSRPKIAMRKGAVIYWQHAGVDSTLWLWDGIRWKTLNSGGSGATFTLENIPALQTWNRGSNKTVYVKDTVRGGMFNWFASGYAADSGTVFTAFGGGYWVRHMVDNEWLNVQWFNAKGDGVTDDRIAMQAAVDYFGNKGWAGTVFFPAVDYVHGKYYRDTIPVYWASFVNMQGEGQGSLIYNDRAEDTSLSSVKYIPIYYGNYQPQSYDSTQSKYFVSSGVTNNRITLTTSTDIDSFAVGQILIIRSLTGFFSKDDVTRPFKPYVVRINRIDSILAPNILVMQDAFDTTLAGAKIAISGHFLPGASKRQDENHHATHFISDVNVNDMSFKSKGQWLLRTSAYKCNWNNVWTYGEEGIGGNAMAYCTWNNFHTFFWKQFHESSIGTHNTVISNGQATWVNNTFDRDVSQPMIRFGENAHNVTLKNINIDAGGNTQRGIRANDATNITVDNLTIIGRNLTNYGVIMENVDDTDIVANIIIKNSKFVLGSTNRYVEMNKNGFTLGVLRDNIIDNCQFYGAVSAASVKFDGTNALVTNNFFQFGDMTGTGALLINGVAYNNYMNNPFQKITNIHFRSNRNATYLVPFIRTDTVNSAVGYKALDNISGGIHNVGIGDSALYTVTSRDGLTAVGASALKVSTGSSATAFGYHSLYSNTTGNFNTANGSEAGLLNTTGAKNLFLMRQAGQANTTGSGNFFIGNNAGSNITTTSQNIIIGNDVDAKSSSAANTFNLYNNLYADNFATTTGTSVGAARFGINIATPLAFLHLSASTVTYPHLILNPGSTPSAPPDGSIWYDGTHFYGRIGATTVQLDNALP